MYELKQLAMGMKGALTVVALPLLIVVLMNMICKWDD